MSADLERKLELSRQKLMQVLENNDPDRVYVAWTGGKDSTLALRLWAGVLKARKEKAKVRALNVDTGFKFPEVIEFRDKIASRWDIGLCIARPGFDLSGYPAAEDSLKCCTDLKVAPLNKAVNRLGIQCLITGVRADEHPSRRDRPYFETAKLPCPRVNPILHWTEIDVWTFIWKENLEYCPLYDRGYRSLGCMPCTAESGSGPGERSGRDASKEGILDTLRSLGYF
ncbi:MAG: phosphoadenosine phosphosulfate reductase family protein [Desulfonatronovibrionaceae bacterium]